ncbi:hypothetical protein [Marininema halotolerans]|uniref:Uncharacterized protein n=1 Tax=Marininema halotolerans TaxID=1155944 RepID=A0A1I6UQN4_9BACL|nr:hypothetical protein [Marininema halotolerans]SFT03785.1 hypothetical protein SAMN05444972_11914 [Marininema halotolerans]
MKSVTYQIGNTTVHIESPDLSEEERERRITEIKKVIRNNFISMALERR